MKQIEHEIKCKHCGRFLGIVNKSMQAQIKCSNSKCKKMNDVKIVFMLDLFKKHEQPHTL